jgi:Kef-type K+ transport system membrane component KefB
LPTPTARLAVQLVCVLLACALVERVGHPLRQPSVVSEKIAGILLGPSVIGLAPAFSAAVFPPDSLPALKAIADIGLILFMFHTGATHDLAALKRHLRRSVLISFAGVAGASVLGGAAAYGIYGQLPAPLPDLGAFLLFACTALAVTAMPVLARVLAEARLLGTVAGAAALHASAVDDALVIAVVCVDAAVANARSVLSGVWTLLCIAGFAATLALVVRPAATHAAEAWLARHSARSDKGGGASGRVPRIRAPLVGAVIAAAFLSAWFTEIVGAHAVVGAFLAGACTPRVAGIASTAAGRVELLTMQLLMPVSAGGEGA